MLAEAGVALAAIVSAGAERGQDRLLAGAPVAIDIGLVIAIALALNGTWPERFFAPLVLLASVRLAGLLLEAKWADILQDRSVLAALLALVLAGHALLLGVQLASLVILATILLLCRGSAQLTRA